MRSKERGTYATVTGKGGKKKKQFITCQKQGGSWGTPSQKKTKIY